jgi:hypothetical protein
MSERTLIQRMFGLNRDGGFRRQRLQKGTPRPDSPVAVGNDDEVDIEVSKAPGLEQWQELVLKYADKVPIVGAGARYYEDSTKRVKFYLTLEGTGEAVESSHPADEIIKILNEYNEEIARAVGLRFLIGESRHTFDIEEKELTTRGAGELYCRRDGTYVLKDRNGKECECGEHLHIWRSYDPDRKWSDLATSSHKSMIDVLESFVIVYAEERAVSIRNALNTGILGVSEDVFAVGGDEDAINSEGSDEGAALERRFQRMLGMVIKNPRDSANFVMPVLVTPTGRKPSECIEHISVAADRDKRKVAERIDMLKEEYAVGVDLPSDQAKGFMADMNHWNGRIVNETAWTDYLAPKIGATVHDAFEEIAAALDIDVTGFTVGLDNTELMSPTDMSVDAFRAYDRGLISDKSARKHTGFTEADAPGEEDGKQTLPDEEEVNDGATDGQGPGGTESDIALPSVESGIEAAAKSPVNLTRLNRDLRRVTLAYERALRKAVRESAEILAPTITDPITAAVVPEEPDPWLRVATLVAATVRKGQEAISLAAARGLATRRAQSWYANHRDRLNAQADRAGADAARIISGWMETNRATSIPGDDQYNIARSIESVGAGGPSTVHPNGDPTGARPLTIMEDDDFLAMIEEEGSAEPVYQWEHGSPAQPFTPHAELNGTTWRQEDEREVLDNQSDFPRSAIYHPGDHRGCTCRYDIEFTRI